MHSTFKTTQATPITPVVIIAGGSGQRLGHIIKCQLKIKNTTLLSRLVYALRDQQAQIYQQHSPIYLNINETNDHLIKNCQTLGITILPDNERHAKKGPLSGIYTGLNTLCCNDSYTGIITLTGDSVLLPNQFYQRLHEKAASSTVPTFCMSKKSNAYIHGYWPSQVIDSIDKSLTKGHYSLGRFLKKVQAKSMYFDNVKVACKTKSLEIDPFFNINTEADKQSVLDWGV